MLLSDILQADPDRVSVPMLNNRPCHSCLSQSCAVRVRPAVEGTWLDA